MSRQSGASPIGGVQTSPDSQHFHTGASPSRPAWRRSRRWRCPCCPCRRCTWHSPARPPAGSCLCRCGTICGCYHKQALDLSVEALEGTQALDPAPQFLLHILLLLLKNSESPDLFLPYLIFVTGARGGARVNFFCPV